MEKKKIIITLSKVFPANHPRAGQPTDFEHKLLLGEKIHTIRKNAELWKKRCKEINAGEKILCVREWTGLPYRSKQREIARYERIGVQEIELCREFLTIDGECHPLMGARIDNKLAIISDIYKNDGLSQDDFSYWFLRGYKGGYSIFKGIIIHFTDFRY